MRSRKRETMLNCEQTCLVATCCASLMYSCQIIIIGVDYVYTCIRIPVLCCTNGISSDRKSVV